MYPNISTSANKNVKYKSILMPKRNVAQFELPNLLDLI